MPQLNLSSFLLLSTSALLMMLYVSLMGSTDMS